MRQNQCRRGACLCAEGDQVEVDGTWRVVGVASAGFNPLSETADDERAGQYGSVGEHADLSLAQTVAFLASMSEDGTSPGDTGGDDAEEGGSAEEKAGGGCATAVAPSSMWLLAAVLLRRRQRRQG